MAAVSEPITTRPAACPGAGGQAQRIEARVPGVDAEGELRAAVPDRLAVPADELDGVEQEPAAAASTPAAPSRAGSSEAGTVGLEAAPVTIWRPEMTTLVCVYGRGEDTVERLVNGVGEDERPAHHADTEHDGERGEDRAESCGPAGL